MTKSWKLRNGYIQGFKKWGVTTIKVVTKQYRQTPLTLGKKNHMKTPLRLTQRFGRDQLLQLQKKNTYSIYQSSRLYLQLHYSFNFQISSPPLTLLILVLLYNCVTLWNEILEKEKKVGTLSWVCLCMNRIRGCLLQYRDIWKEVRK